MSDINFKLNWAVTPLSNIFIEEYMTMPSHPVYSLVYIYALKKAIFGEKITNNDIAEHFQIMESEVTKIWQYWENSGIIRLENTEGQLNLEFLTPNSRITKPEIQKIQETNKLRRENKPVYNPDDIKKISEQDESIASLLKMAENLLKKPLSPNDVNTIVSFYDWLGLSIEVIYVLLSHCGRHGKSMRYMEKVAIDWSEKGIQDQETAEDYLNVFLSEYKKIMRAYGISDRSPSEEEQAYMSSWIRTLKMPVEVIKLACSRTIKNTGKVSFAYTNKILNDWHNEGVKSLAQVEILDQEFSKKKAATKSAAKTSKVSQKINDYEQRSYDNDTLENIFKRKAGD